MASFPVLRIPRSDEDGSFVLARASKPGARPLDIKLVASEGETAYSLSRKPEALASSSLVAIIEGKQHAHSLYALDKLTPFC